MSSPFLSPQTHRLLAHANKKYDVKPEFLWTKYPNVAILRHSTSRHWFAVLFRLSARHLKLDHDTPLDFIVLRFPPELIADTLATPGFYPGYHMNKKHWYTIILDDSIPDSELYSRLDISYDLATK